MEAGSDQVANDTSVGGVSGVAAPDHTDNVEESVNAQDGCTRGLDPFLDIYTD